MKLSKEAQKLFDYLPEDGSKIGGITIQRELNISKAEYQRGRDELKEAKLVTSGQGRGGSLRRIGGAKPHVGPTKEERLEHAREVKQVRSREKKVTQDLKLKIVDYCHSEGYKQVTAEDVSFAGIDKMPIIAVWKGTRAQMYTIAQLEYDKLRATHYG